jgi:DmsE family decaheme c-type cytochrome
MLHQLNKENAMKRMSPSWNGIIGAIGVAALALLAGGARAQAPGPEVCKACHEGYVASWEATKHGQKGNDRGPTCVTCHGDATEHVKAGGGKGVGGLTSFTSRSVPADTKSGVCLACHSGNRHLAFWDSGMHRKNEVACSDCHALHGPPPAGMTVALKKPNPTAAPFETTTRQLEYETCTTCHKDIRTQLTKPSHHPIIEGKLNCTDCHNPHGALSRAMVKAESIPGLCTTCHSEKRGPFMWEHPPVEENCLTCHNPHGANHNRLLAEKAPNVCQDCHDASRHPGTAYGGEGGWGYFPPATSPNTRLIARGCVNCHFQVHGSNAPGARGKFFLR